MSVDLLLFIDPTIKSHSILMISLVNRCTTCLHAFMCSMILYVCKWDQFLEKRSLRSKHEVFVLCVVAVAVVTYLILLLRLIWFLLIPCGSFRFLFIQTHWDLKMNKKKSLSTVSHLRADFCITKAVFRL